jgi:hypothetical protein
MRLVESPVLALRAALQAAIFQHRGNAAPNPDNFVNFVNGKPGLALLVAAVKKPPTFNIAATPQIN